MIGHGGLLGAFSLLTNKKSVSRDLLDQKAMSVKLGLVLVK